MLPCDVTSDEQIAALAGTLDREFGGLDFLVHGAAFAPAAELSTHSARRRAMDFAWRSTSAPIRWSH